MNDELITVLRQIRDELREMNGKDAEGNRLWGKGKRPDIQNPPYMPGPILPYNPYGPAVWGGVSAPGTTWMVNDHQGENPLQSEDG